MNKLTTSIIIPSLLICFCIDEPPVVENRASVLEFAQSIDGDRVFPWVERLAAVHLGDVPIDNEGIPPEERYPTDHLTHAAAAGFIADAFTEIGYAPDTVALGEEPHVAFNIVAQQRGVLFPDEVVLVGGHLDAFYGGADDNSTAIAALLEIARAVRERSFARTIRFVAFDLEEFGSAGSTRYIEAGYAKDVVSAVVMDLIGYSSDEPGSQKGIMGIKFPDKGNYLFVIGNENSARTAQQVVNLADASGIAKSVGVIAPGDGAFFLSQAFMRSDHGLLWYKGVPTLFFTDGAELRSPHYHRASDLPETINSEFLIDNVRLVGAAVAMLAEVQP